MFTYPMRPVIFSPSNFESSAAITHKRRRVLAGNLRSSLQHTRAAAERSQQFDAGETARGVVDIHPHYMPVCVHRPVTRSKSRDEEQRRRAVLRERHEQTAEPAEQLSQRPMPSALAAAKAQPTRLKTVSSLGAAHANMMGTFSILISWNKVHQKCRVCVYACSTPNISGAAEQAGGQQRRLNGLSAATTSGVNGSPRIANGARDENCKMTVGTSVSPAATPPSSQSVMALSPNVRSTNFSNDLIEQTS